MGQQLRPNLTGVSETLLIPLAVRHFDNQSAHPFLPDPMANTIVERLQQDLTKFAPESGDLIGVVARGHILDAAVNRFITAHPDASIINLGAGLCTRFERLKTKPAKWIDVDLPQVEPYWNAAFSTDTERQFIAASATDPDLWQRLGREISTPVMVIAEGLLMYLAEADVRMMFQDIAKHFSKAEILIEVIAPFFTKRSAKHPSVSKTTAQFDWGLKSTSELENWEGGIRVLDEWLMMNWRPAGNRPLPKISFAFRIMRHIPLIKNGFRIAHLRLGSGES